VTVFQLNGETTSTAVDGKLPLVHVLRNPCDAKDVRFGCGAGNCGACTVIVDGVAQQSCGLSTESIEGCDVFTPAALQSDPVGISGFTSFFRRASSTMWLLHQRNLDVFDCIVINASQIPPKKKS